MLLRCFDVLQRHYALREFYYGLVGADVMRAVMPQLRYHIFALYDNISPILFGMGEKLLIGIKSDCSLDLFHHSDIVLGITDRDTVFVRYVVLVQEVFE